jgi:hypothetical protein
MEYLDGISAFLPRIIDSAGSEEFDHFAGLKKGDAASSQEDVPLHSEAELSRRTMSGLGMGVLISFAGKQPEPHRALPSRDVAQMANL